MKGERMAKRSSFGSVMRKKLSDITNSHPKLDEKTLNNSPTSDAFINQLIQEKLALMKLIDERNKIIEFSGTQLQSLRISLQKLQQQNWILASSNTQIVAELNLGREKLKALQHELVCKDALLKVKYVNNEGTLNMNCQNNGFKSKEVNETTEEQLHKTNNDDKPCNRNRTRAGRCKSLGSCTSRRQGPEKEKTENKRRCLRRQSARFKSQEQESTDNLFEIKANPLFANEESSQRSSIGRPLRRVANVKSYREIPVNIKMRRAE